MEAGQAKLLSLMITRIVPSPGRMEVLLPALRNFTQHKMVSSKEDAISQGRMMVLMHVIISS